MNIRSLIITLCVFPVACSGDPTPSLDEDVGVVTFVTTPAPVCVAPETMNYEIDESLNETGLAMAISGVEVFNTFALEVLGREVLAYQGRTAHWTPGLVIEPIKVYVTKNDEEFEQFVAEYPYCTGRNPGGCGPYRTAAFVHAGRLQSAFTGTQLDNLLAYVTAHEMGHVILGGGHLPQADALMNATARFEMPVLSAADKGWFCQVYCCNDKYPVIE